MKKEYDFSKARVGAVEPVPPGKTRITIRLDNEIIDWFRLQVDLRGGGNYQTMINNSLKEHIANRETTIEDTLRRVLWEEMPKISYLLTLQECPNKTANSYEAERNIPGFKPLDMPAALTSPERQFFLAS